MYQRQLSAKVQVIKKRDGRFCATYIRGLRLGCWHRPTAFGVTAHEAVDILRAKLDREWTSRQFEQHPTNAMPAVWVWHGDKTAQVMFESAETSAAFRYVVRSNRVEMGLERAFTFESFEKAHIVLKLYFNGDGTIHRVDAENLMVQVWPELVEAPEPVEEPEELASGLSVEE